MLGLRFTAAVGATSLLLNETGGGALNTVRSAGVNVARLTIRKIG